MELKGTETVKVKENVVWKELNRELVVLNLSNGFYFTLNDTARSIWSCFNKKKEINSIVNELMNTYSVSREQALTDVEGVISQCLKDCLIDILIKKGDDIEAKS